MGSEMCIRDRPNFYRFSDGVLYQIKVDVNGDAVADLTYQFTFTTTFLNPKTPDYQLGVIGLPPSPADPTSQYVNLNVRQSYALTEIGGSGPTVLLQNARIAPYRVGPQALTGTPNGATEAAYDALANAAILPIPSADMRVFVGPRDEGFFVDVAAASDRLDIRNPGSDSVSGFNVHTLALEIPKTRFAAAGDTDSIIGVWATASRNRVRVLGSGGTPNAINPGDAVQVSRLANPLVNELLIPLEAKDIYNATSPNQDDTAIAPSSIANYIVNPGPTQSSNAFIPALATLTGCTAVAGRADLQAALLTGIPAGVVPGFPGNFTGPTRADLMRLNYSIPPSASPNPLGLVGGDPAGFPNGRRVGDDVTDIDLKAAGGALQPLVGLPPCPVANGLSDNVSSNDVPYLTTFPYLGRPHEGYRHDHDHNTADGGAAPLPPSPSANKVCTPSQNIRPGSTISCSITFNVLNPGSVTVIDTLAGLGNSGSGSPGTALVPGSAQLDGVALQPAQVSLTADQVNRVENTITLPNVSPGQHTLRLQFTIGSGVGCFSQGNNGARLLLGGNAFADINNVSLSVRCG